MNRAIRFLGNILIGVMLSSVSVARDFTFAWDEVIMTLPAGDANHGYDNTRTYYELRTKLNNEAWISTITAPQVTQITRPIPIVPSDALVVQVRTRGGMNWVCDRVNSPDCDKSSWASFPSLPTADTPILYPNTPSNLVVTRADGALDPVLTGTSIGIGTSLQAGSIEKIGNQYRMVARGIDIWGSADSGYFAHTQKTGDFTITARVASIQRGTPAPNEWAKAGIMIRESLTPGSRHAFMTATHSNGVSFQSRASTNGTSVSASTGGITEPVYVRLSRTGNVFVASHSSNGTTWSDFASRTITMGSTVYAGLASTSHASGVAFESFFDNLTGF